MLLKYGRLNSLALATAAAFAGVALNACGTDSLTDGVVNAGSVDADANGQLSEVQTGVDATVDPNADGGKGGSDAANVDTANGGADGTDSPGQDAVDKDVAANEIGESDGAGEEVAEGDAANGDATAGDGGGGGSDATDQEINGGDAASGDAAVGDAVDNDGAVGDAVGVDVATGGDAAPDGILGNDSSGLDSNGVDANAADTKPDVPVACKIDGDCPSAGSCATANCVAGTCVATPKGDGVICDDGDLCTASDACKAGACVGAAKNCDDKNSCTDDSCKAGVCSNSPNAGKCDDANACTTNDACKAGSCTGDAVKCDDSNVCTDDKCDTKTGCVHANNTIACDDASLCTSGDKCAAGICAGANSVDCDDGNPCTKDGCDPKSGLCGFLASATGSPCEDGNVCTTGDGCNQGKCKAGPAKDCSDGNACTDDTCDGKTGCASANNVAACDDGNACTDKDLCAAGKCAGAAKVCTDGNVCTDDNCDPVKGCQYPGNLAPCSTGDKCVFSTCKDTKCVAGAKMDCADNTPCTADTCDSNIGCLHTNLADGSPCAPGDLCVGPSTCTVGKCSSGAKTNCDDGNVCTSDACDGKTGCLWAPNVLPCDDANACTIGDICGVVPGKGPACTSGKPIDLKKCDDSNLCTDDSCDPKAGCVHANNAVACDDSNVCTTGEHCSAAKCQGGKATDCDDGKVCTNDLCDPITGVCSWVGNNNLCDDANGCTIGDVCAGGKCVSGKAKNCDDASLCTNDSCDAKSGNCVYAPAINCDDGNVCTDDSCDGKTGLCLHANNKGPCSDGNLCTSGDTCDGNSNCAAGALLKCDDGLACTADSCDVATGKCVFVNVADATPCDDGLACTASSACKAGKCAATAPCIYLNDPFTCALAGYGWTIDVPKSPFDNVPRNVKWKVDMVPPVGSPEQIAAHQCSMNFNNDVNTCDGYKFNGQGYCIAPAGTTRSPAIDWTNVSALTVNTPVVVFDAYYDVDPTWNGGGPSDAPYVVIRDTTNNAVLASAYLSKDPQNLKVWRPNLSLPLTAAYGHKFQVQFLLAEPDAGNAYTGEQGTGFYVDNVVVKANMN